MTPEQEHPFPVKRLILPLDGRPPSPTAVSARDAILLDLRVSRVRQLVESAASHRAPGLPDFDTPSESECERGWKRWLLSHHLFVPMLALAGFCLERAAGATAADEFTDACSWIESAARLRRGCGTLFLYGVDFEPCSLIYCGYIRSRMPPAFSGYQARERQNAFLPGLTAFRDTPAGPDGTAICARMRDLWAQADIRYHDLHQRCMFRAVSPSTGSCPHSQGAMPESLRSTYRRQHGAVPQIDENALNDFDVWFGIDRRLGLGWLDYATQVAGVVREITEDLEAGHRLSQDVTADLFDSISTVLTLLGNGVGQQNRTSCYNLVSHRSAA